MASQRLETIIAINAEVGNGFSAVGSTLSQLGSMVNGISQELIDFGKDSVNVYREYEKSMADAEVALSTTYGRNTKELGSVMSQLDAAATDWAATTVFHTNDVANAISEAAHAGWDFNQIMTGIPAAIELANAGSLDLSEAVNYIVKAANGMGLEFDEQGENIGNLVDLWAFAANSSATNIDEVGQAMLRMGSTMRFTEGTEELMTLIAVTANAGSVGSEAGTMIRNSIMRLAAPTDKASEVLAELGATSEEVASTLEDEALAAANARLAAQGFSAYDQEGKLKPVLDIYRDLYMALAEVNGGFEDMEHNDDVVKILHDVFQNRSLTEALTLLRGASESYDDLYEKMKNGEAEGYGEYAAQKRVETLDGKIEIFESKVERLKQAVGEELAPQLESALGSIGGIVDSVADMDEGMFSALVSGLEVIAAAGPALLLAGGAFRLIGYALTPAGGIGLGLIALTSAAAAIKELQDADFASNFGNMELDTAEIQSYVQGLGEDFKSAYSEVDRFKEALNEAVTSYETASSTFSSKLFTDMLTNAKLTDEDKKELENLGTDMFTSVQEAISNSAAASMSYWNVLFGGEGVAEYDPAYQEIIDITNQAYEDAMAQAEGISQNLRDAMTSAFEDGEIDPDEYQNILSYMRSYNDAIAQAAAEAQSEEDYVKMGMWLHRAQTASWEDIKDIANETETERDSILASQEKSYLNERFRLEYRGADEATLKAAEDKFNQQQMETKSSYDEFLTTLWDSQVQQSGLSDAYASLEDFATQYMQGSLSADTIEKLITGEMGKSKYAGQTHLDSIWNTTDREDLGKIMGYMINSFGGQSGIAESIEWYRSQGNEEMANNLSRLYTMEQLINSFGITQTAGDKWYEKLGPDFNSTNQSEHLPGKMNREAFEQTVQVNASDYTVENARKTASAIGDVEDFGTISYLFDTLKKEISGENIFGTELFGAYNGLNSTNSAELLNMFSNLSQSYDLEKVVQDTISAMPQEWQGEGYETQRDLYGMYQLMYGDASMNAEDYRITVTPEVDTSAIGELDPVPLPIEPRVEGTDAAEQLQAQGVTVDVEGDTQSLEATIDGADGQTLMEYVDGDATNLSMSITDQDGKTLTQNVTGDATSLANIINSYNGRTITVNIAGNKMFASGGRATTASIFGEAGPEWAIPEEHSQRTADLLNAAREASGFTWPDLLSMYGGLNANTENTPTTIIYSPTVNAQDATGVDQVLQADKQRLDKWWEEKKMRDEVEVYA